MNPLQKGGGQPGSHVYGQSSVVSTTKPLSDLTPPVSSLGQNIAPKREEELAPLPGLEVQQGKVQKAAENFFFHPTHMNGRLRPRPPGGDDQAVIDGLSRLSASYIPGTEPFPDLPYPSTSARSSEDSLSWLPAHSRISAASFRVSEASLPELPWPSTSARSSGDSFSWLPADSRISAGSFRVSEASLPELPWPLTLARSSEDLPSGSPADSRISAGSFRVSEASLPELPWPSTSARSSEDSLSWLPADSRISAGSFRVSEASLPELPCSLASERNSVQLNDSLVSPFPGNKRLTPEQLEFLRSPRIVPREVKAIVSEGKKSRKASLRRRASSRNEISSGTTFSRLNRNAPEYTPSSPVVALPIETPEYRVSRPAGSEPFQNMTTLEFMRSLTKK